GAPARVATPGQTNRRSASRRIPAWKCGTGRAARRRLSGLELGDERGAGRRGGAAVAEVDVARAGGADDGDRLRRLVVSDAAHELGTGVAERLRPAVDAARVELGEHRVLAPVAGQERARTAELDRRVEIAGDGDGVVGGRRDVERDRGARRVAVALRPGRA